jgi:tetratricopeptide (TPR) repeat protein
MMTAKSDPGVARKNHRLKKIITFEACISEVGDGPVETLHDGRGTELLVPEKASSEAMSPEEMVEAITAELFNRIDSAPWGTRSRIQRKAKVSKNYLNSWKDPERVRLLPLAHALEFLGIEPAEFFSTVFNQGSSQVAEPWPLGRRARAQLEALAKSLESTSEPVDFFAAVTPPRPAGLPPSGVKKALQRMATPPSQAEESSLGIEIEGIIDQQELTRLDEFRWENPREANLLLERSIKDSPLELLPEILLVYGSTFLQLDRLGDARWTFFATASRAQETGDRVTLALAFHKRAKVEDAAANFSEALALLRYAGGIFYELGELGKGVRVLVSTAYHYANRRMDNEAIGCAQIALLQMPDGDHWGRAGSFQLLARCFSEIGAHDAALENLDEAKLLLPRCPKGAAKRFAWLEARVKKDTLSIRERARLLGDAAAFFLENGEILDGALATLEQARCLLLQGEIGVVQEIARNAKALAFAAEEFGERGQVAATALMLVYRAGLEGAVTESILSTAIHSARKAAGSPAAFYFS